MAEYKPLFNSGFTQIPSRSYVCKQGLQLFSVDPVYHPLI